MSLVCVSYLTISMIGESHIWKLWPGSKSFYMYFFIICTLGNLKEEFGENIPSEQVNEAVCLNERKIFRLFFIHRLCFLFGNMCFVWDDGFSDGGNDSRVGCSSYSDCDESFNYDVIDDSMQ